MNRKINTKRIIENMEQKNIKVVSIDTDNMLYMCDDGKRKQWKLNTLKRKMIHSEQQMIATMCKELRFNHQESTRTSVV